MQRVDTTLERAVAAALAASRTEGRPQTPQHHRRPLRTLFSRSRTTVPTIPLYEKRIQANVVPGAVAEGTRMDLQPQQEAQSALVALAKTRGVKRELAWQARRPKEQA